MRLARKALTPECPCSRCEVRKEFPPTGPPPGSEVGLLTQGLGVPGGPRARALGFHGRKVRGEAARGGNVPGRRARPIDDNSHGRASAAAEPRLQSNQTWERERESSRLQDQFGAYTVFFLQFPLSRWRVVVGCVGCANEMCRRRGTFFASSIPRMMDHGTWTTPQLMAFGPESGVAAAAAGGGAAAADAAVPNLTNRLFIHPSIQCRCARARCRDWGHDGMVPEK